MNTTRTLLFSILFFPLLSWCQTFQWAKRAGLWAFDLGHAIGTDNAGNVYIAGKYEMNANFGGTTVGCAGNHDIYIAKYTSSGNFVWVKTAGGSSGDYAHAMAVDGSGNVYIAGEFETTTSFGGGISLKTNGDNDIFVAKYNTNGVLQWAKKLGGGSKSDKALGISIYGTSIYITGKFESTGNFAGTTLTSAGGKEMFIAKYTTSGVFQWAKRGGGPGSDEGAAICNDASGNVFVTGWFTGTASFSGISLTSKGAKDIFVAKYSPSGSIIWAKKFGGTYDDFGRGIKVDNNNRVFITGGFRYKGTFGSTVLTSGGQSDVYVARLDASGNVVWAKKGGGTADDEAMALAIDGSSNVFITGKFGNTANFSGTSLAGVDDAEIFFAGYDVSGNLKWVIKAGGSADKADPGRDPETGLSIATDPSGNIVASGSYRSSSLFGSTKLSGWDHTDIFITKIGQNTSIAGRVAAPSIEPGDSASYCRGVHVTLRTMDDSAAQFRWLRDGEILAGSAANTWKASSPGKYQVMVIRGADTMLSKATRVYETTSLPAEITMPERGFCEDSASLLAAPQGEGYQYQWKRNGRNISGARSHTLHPTRNGRYQVKIVQGSCFDWSPSVNVEFKNCQTAEDTIPERTEITGLTKLDSSSAIRIYPNPNSGRFTMQLHLNHLAASSGPVRVQVVNSMGNLFYERVIEEPASYMSEEISLQGNATTGVYILQIFIGEHVEQTKILLLR